MLHNDQRGAHQLNPASCAGLGLMAETPPTNMGKFMKERPILFSAPMVRAILRGEKTQTRRAILIPCPYGAPGDLLWVRETFMDLHGTGIEVGTRDTSRYAYAADTPPGSYGDEARKDYGLKWRPSIFMPRAASRITLEVTNILVERLNDISEEDAIAEGVTRLEYTGENGGPNRFTVEHPNGWSNNQPTAKATYKMLWESINGPDTWNDNPLVWAITFKQVDHA